MYEIQYAVVEEDTKPEDVSECNKNELEMAYHNIDDWECIAENCAEEYWNNNEGWEASWPLFFMIWANGEFKKKYEIDTEYEPVFTATKIED